MSKSDFELRDGKVYSTVSGDLVATVDREGNLKMQQGKNALTPRVKEFMAAPPVPPPDAPEVPEAMEQMTENHDFSGALPDDEEVNTHILDDNNERVFFGDAPRHGTGVPAPEEKPIIPVPDPNITSVWDIPESELPAFDPALGTATPEFKNFIRKHKFNKVQAAELVRRLSRRK